MERFLLYWMGFKFCQLTGVTVQETHAFIEGWNLALCILNNSEEILPSEMYSMRAISKFIIVSSMW